MSMSVRVAVTQMLLAFKIVVDHATSILRS